MNKAKQWNKGMRTSIGARNGQPAFTRPTKDCLYVRILNLLDELSDASYSKREVYDLLGMKDVPAHYHNCVWGGMRNAGFISMEREGHNFYYTITDKGREYLEYYGM